MKKKPSALKQYRKARNLSLEAMANELGVSRRTLIRYEHEVPPCRVVELAKKTGIPSADLIPSLLVDGLSA